MSDFNEPFEPIGEVVMVPLSSGLWRVELSGASAELVFADSQEDAKAKYFAWFPGRNGSKIVVLPHEGESGTERVIYHDGRGLTRRSMAR